MFEIRNIQKSDIPTLVKLEEELLKETVGCEMLQSELHNQFAYFYVGVYDNEVIGYLSVWMVEETVDVINFVTEVNYFEQTNITHCVFGVCCCFFSLCC